MVKNKKNIKEDNSNIIQGVLAIGIFVTAFYFIFLYKKNEKCNNTNSLKKGKLESFCGKTPNECVQGYKLPLSLNDLDWNNKEIEVVSKPDAPNMFKDTILPTQSFKIRKVEDSITGHDEVVGVNIKGNLLTEKYSDIKDNIVLK